MDGSADQNQVTIEVTVNGENRQTSIRSNLLLVDFLRYELGLTGTKEGCSVGVCGACSVLVDGKITTACLTLAAMTDGCEITTAEGLANQEQLLPIQQSFIDHGGFQCGICTSGQVIAARALLDQNPHPTEDEIKAWMMGNLCRCTGYYGIIRSIQNAAGE
ncbi:MAG: (2Fe-2S)-binding protein [Immundisolibacteraceae bacterium]|nr:(2Fe-2S)-binding protein [Immundisolibacteraceae bacterium]